MHVLRECLFNKKLMTQQNICTTTKGGAFYLPVFQSQERFHARVSLTIHCLKKKPSDFPGAGLNPPTTILIPLTLPPHHQIYLKYLPCSLTDDLTSTLSRKLPSPFLHPLKRERQYGPDFVTISPPNLGCTAYFTLDSFSVGHFLRSLF